MKLFKNTLNANSNKEVPMSAIQTQHRFRVDLDSCPLEATLPRPLMHSDALADEIVLAVRRGVNPVDLAGMTVTGFMTFTTQQTLPLPGSVNDSIVTLPLPGEAYAVPGAFTLTVQLQSGDTRHTLLRLTGQISRTSADEFISSGELLPTLPDLLDDIADMRAATRAAQDAAANVGQVVIAANAAPAIVLEASGDPIAIADAAALPALEVCTNILADRQGSGDVSPDNIRPFIGHTAVQLFRAAAFDASADPALVAQLPQTIFGGVLNWTQGTLTVTHLLDDLTNAVWTASQTAKRYLVRYTTDTFAALEACSHFPTSGSAFTNSCWRSGSQAAFNTAFATLAEWKAYLAEQSAAGTPLCILRGLPPVSQQTLTLTPQQLTLLAGSNALWSSAGSTALTYIADTRTYIDNALSRS